MQTRLIILLSFLLCFGTSKKIAASPFPPVGDSSTISLLTESPATDFYTAWGHSAIRVHNTADNSDMVFNFGTFDFNAPYFYLKFLKGTLLYTESVYPYDVYLADAYQDPHRIMEQQLDITPAQKQAISDELYRLYLPENRLYKYEWSGVNCSTKLRDILKLALGNDFPYSTRVSRDATSFRAHEAPYLENDLWLRFGTNIVLGKPADRLISPYEEAFLPDGLFGLVKTARKTNGKPLVKLEHAIMNNKSGEEAQTFVSPMLVFWFAFMFIAGFSFSPIAGKIIDFVVFPLCGLTGILLAYLWFGSVHAETRQNWNILWAFPLHLLYPFFKGQLKTLYSWLIVGLTIFMVSFWAFIPQTMEPAILAILLIQNIRALFNLDIRKIIDRVFAG